MAEVDAHANLCWYEKAIFENCASIADCIIKVNNIEVDKAKDINAVRPMYNLIEYIDNYLKKSGSLR